MVAQIKCERFHYSPCLISEMCPHTEVSFISSSCGNYFILQGILSSSHEVAQSDILRQFLAQTASDKEDEAFNSRIRNMKL